MRNRIPGIAVAVSLVMVACSEGPEPAATRPAVTAPAEAPAAKPAAAATADASAEAARLFNERCTTCHGPAGAGDGPASAGLTPPPRNFQDPAWQQSVSDQHIERIIQFGGAAVGRSPAMPANPDLMSKADVVAALRAHIRELASR
jgi:mono/diheme cytochrome c family protein